MNKLLQNTGYFLVGTSVLAGAGARVAYTYASAGVLTAIKIGKREMCSEELHGHHDGCPSCDS
jgi:hypothetical protein|tara:strand:+ start:14433 stop:14621 length:189 start_codon:yes stop_codon:yes gene_type:complete